ARSPYTTLFRSGPRPDEVEACGHARELLRLRAAVELELVRRERRIEAHVGLGPETVERDRYRADCRNLQPLVGLAPILHERDIRARTCLSVHRMFSAHRPAGTGPALPR